MQYLFDLFFIIFDPLHRFWTKFRDLLQICLNFILGFAPFYFVFFILIPLSSLSFYLFPLNFFIILCLIDYFLFLLFYVFFLFWLDRYFFILTPLSFIYPFQSFKSVSPEYILLLLIIFYSFICHINIKWIATPKSTKGWLFINSKQVYCFIKIYLPNILASSIQSFLKGQSIEWSFIIPTLCINA